MQNFLKINNDFSFMIVISDIILAGTGSEYVLVVRRKLVDIIRTSEGFRLGVKSEFLRKYIREISEFSQLTVIKVKVSPLQAMKADGGCGCTGPHIHSHGTSKK